MFETIAQIWWCEDIKVSNNLYHVLQSSMNPNTLRRLPVAKTHSQMPCPGSLNGSNETAMYRLIHLRELMPWISWLVGATGTLGERGRQQQAVGNMFLLHLFLQRVMGEILKKTVQEWSTRRHTKLWKSSTERFFNNNHWLGAKRKKEGQISSFLFETQKELSRITCTLYNLK